MCISSSHRDCTREKRSRSSWVRDVFKSASRSPGHQLTKSALNSSNTGRRSIQRRRWRKNTGSSADSSPIRLASHPPAVRTSACRHSVRGVRPCTDVIHETADTRRVIADPLRADKPAPAILPVHQTLSLQLLQGLTQSDSGTAEALDHLPFGRELLIGLRHASADIIGDLFAYALVVR